LQKVYATFELIRSVAEIEFLNRLLATRVNSEQAYRAMAASLAARLPLSLAAKTNI
jgi:hypothetical protein